ncbi:filamentous hemagglutinin [Kosakonia radicincitans]|nr:filamentous hemagglutinin [Kosakonia radicincitans]
MIRDQASQQQDVNTLSRDTAHANGSIDQIFDKEKEQRRLQTAQMISEIGTQVADIARTEGDIAKAKAVSDPAALAAAKETLIGKGNLNPTPEEISDQAGRTAEANFGTGSTLQRAITAATAAIQAVASGDIKSALAGAAAPYIANEIAAQIPETDPAGRVLAHAVVNAALAAASGKDAASAAAGAATGELTGIIALDAWGIKDTSQLSEEQKQTVSALATLASGLAGALAGDSGANAIAAAQAGKTTVENNAMSDEERPVPYGVTPGDVAIAKAKEDAASGLTKKLNELGQAIDKATQCTFGRACSSDDQEQESKPNVAGNMTDEEKAEYGGAGSGTGTPPPENDPKNQNEDKPANIKMADDKYLKRNGIDAHKLKEEFLGDGKNSNYDIYINKDSGELWIFRKGGKGDGIATGEFIK